MKTIEQILTLVFLTVILNSCDNLQPDLYYTDDSYGIDVDAYAPYDHLTRSGYYCNQWYPNDRVISNSYKFINDKPVNIDIHGEWVVKAGWEYVSMDNQTTTKTLLFGTVSGFIRDRVVVDSIPKKEYGHEYYETTYINFPIIIGTTSFVISDEFYDTAFSKNKTDLKVIDGYQLNSKFKTLKLYSDDEAIVIIVVDISADLRQMVIQTQEFVDNVYTSTAPISYRRYLLEKK